ncbi:hypothetical protein [Streptomyces coelicoflavus]|uniref:Uncharacterized protein n=1 Tax=Streptomyces coelicoflavus TaxID=285562 RepID=A0A6N9UX73_9ACTN|nr:hypothetical protein [Streptomyces coelicoflavus]NEB19712.1 hypothetical protein [Streptomyces coelicoflavus]
MDTETGIALAAVVISAAAALVSTHQAKTAKSSADAAKEQLAAAKEANQLTRQQMDRQTAKEQQEAAETEQSAQREAEKVQVGLTNNGGSLAVRITNDSLRTVTDIQLADVTPEEVGPWRSWKPNPNVSRSLSTTSWSLLHPGTDVTVALWLLDENGAHVPRLPSKPAVKIHFRDSDGQWWAAVTDRTTTRIDPPASTA